MRGLYWPCIDQGIWWQIQQSVKLPPVATICDSVTKQFSFHPKHWDKNIARNKTITFFFEMCFKFIYLFIYLFLAVLGLRFCTRAFSSCGERGPLFIMVHGPLIVTASLVVEHRLQTRRLSSCDSRAQLLHGMWDLPRPGLEPVSPALAGRFSTTAPPGKPNNNL